MSTARLKKVFKEKIRPELQKTLNLSNPLAAPQVKKIVLNVGVPEAVGDSRILNTVIETLDKIAGQKSVRTYAKKSIAGFKIREGMPIGAKVTLRGKNMYVFLDKLINLALPKVRDFQGVPDVFDKHGNYNLGIKEWAIFPEVDTTAEKTFGLNITIQIAAQEASHAYELLKGFGMPFKKNQKTR